MKKVFFTLLFFNIFHLSFSQTGQPFLKNYPPYEYGGEGQIWTITQDNRGIMYFGGNSAIFQYDGENWQTIETPGHNMAVRSMDTDKNGRIYVGIVGNIGYLKPTEQGKLEYVSLKNEIDSAYRNFTDVWTTIVKGNNVYFLSSEYLFRYNPDSTSTIKVIGEKKSFFLIYKAHNQLFATIRGEGLKKIEGDKLKSLPMGENIYSMFVLPYKKNKFLVEMGQKGLFVYDPKATDTTNILTKKYFNKKNVSKTDSFIINNQLYIGATSINNGKYALSTILGGIAIINENGKLVNVINKQHHLLSQTVHFLYTDNDNQLWAGLTYGLAYLEINSPFRYFDDTFGFEGSIYHTFINDNQLFISTNVGLFYWNKNKFFSVNKLKTLQVFEPKSFKYPNSKKILHTVSTVMGIFKIEKNNAFQLNNISPNTLIQSKYDSNNVWITRNYNLELYSLKDELKTLRKSYELDFIPMVLCEKNKNNLWLLDGKNIVLFNISSQKIDRFKDNNETENMEFYATENLNNQILFLTNKGLYAYNDKINKFVQKNSYFDNFTTGKKILQIEKISKNEFWLITKKNNISEIVMLKKTENKFVPQSTPFKRLPEFDYFYPSGDSLMWIISPNAVFTFNKNEYNLDSSINNVIIRKIVVSDSTIFFGSFAKNDKIALKQPENLNINLEYKNNNISFYFALPYFSKSSDNKYSYKLIGSDNEQWSEWTNKNFKEFTNLHEGDYVFKVKAKNVYGIETQTSQIQFSISPPWYRTIIAYISYVLLLGFVVWLSIKLYSVRLKKENERLENLVQQRTVEINQQNEEIKTQAENLSEINKLLNEKNDEVNQQNEEIKAIAESLKDANKKITSKNTYITDSINYAKRIQSALMPSKELLNKYLKNYFIIFLPKDIISGDFYWIKKIDKYLLIAIADSTGHGVPGGFISMLGISYLNEVVRKEDVFTPAKALEQLRKIIKTSLNQTKMEDSQDDAIDMALVAIDLNTNKLLFSGAYIPLYITRNQELQIFKPVLNPIGIFPYEKPFVNHEFKLQKNDMIYLSTDGYKDQLNQSSERFQIKRLKSLLTVISEKSTNEQKRILIEKYNEWRLAKTQTDDILILGFRWNL